MEKSLADEKALITELQKNTSNLTNQISSLKETNAIANYAFEWRRSMAEEESNQLLNYLLQPAITEEQRLRKFLFSPATSGLKPRVGFDTYQVNEQIDGKSVQMNYHTYHYNEGDAYLAEIWAEGTIDGETKNNHITSYGGNGTPGDKLTEYKNLDVKKTYNVKAAPGLGRFWDSYDITLTADFGKEEISGKGVKVQENNFTQPGNIIFNTSRIYRAMDTIVFGRGTVEVDFASSGKQQLSYRGTMIGAEAEKIVGRIGDSSMIGNEQK
ncbi:hypothetical protein [Pasteurella testudinis]|uniref:hypothetical protein n=1 Tax=Pasteurella testudinis TaxID=761 RepID=UPI004059CC60